MISGNLNWLAKCLSKTYIQRTDLYAKQLDNGSYVCIQKPLSNDATVF